MFRVILTLTSSPPNHVTYKPLKCLKRCRDSPAKEDAAGPSGVTNPRQAEDHKVRLDQAIEKLRDKAMEEEIEEIMGPFIEEVKEICLEVYAPMESADVKKVLHALGDPYGLALRPQTEDVERQLELVLPEEEVTEPGDLIKMVKNVEPISDKAKELLIKMMEHTSEAYFQAAQVAEQFTQLARECSSPQLMTIMKYAARPIIQIEGAIDASGHITKKRIDLPEKLAARVNLTLLPNPDAHSLKREDKSSPTKLLAGIIYYLIKKNFGGGCTQTLIVNHFNIKPKNVALCVTGRKYLGGKDRQAATEHRSKRRHQESSSDDD